MLDAEPGQTAASAIAITPAVGVGLIVQLAIVVEPVAVQPEPVPALLLTHISTCVKPVVERLVPLV